MGTLLYILHFAWLFSLHRIIISKIYPCQHVSMVHSFIAEYYFIVWIYHSLCIYSPTDQPGLFSVLSLLQKYPAVKFMYRILYKHKCSLVLRVEWLRDQFAFTVRDCHTGFRSGCVTVHLYGH